MLESARNRVVALPRVSTKVVSTKVVTRVEFTKVALSAGTLASFGWLLIQNKIHPIVVYLLQLYLTF
jgi:hypothetical protein